MQECKNARMQECSDGMLIFEDSNHVNAKIESL